MEILITIVLSYLIINFVGTVYEVIRDRKEIFSVGKETFNGLMSNFIPVSRLTETMYKVVFITTFVVGVLVEVFIWAPEKIWFRRG